MAALDDAAEDLTHLENQFDWIKLVFLFNKKASRSSLEI